MSLLFSAVSFSLKLLEQLAAHADGARPNPHGEFQQRRISRSSFGDGVYAINILAHYCHALANYVRDLGARGVIEFVRNTIAGLWLKAEDFQQIVSAAFQIRMK